MLCVLVSGLHLPPCLLSLCSSVRARTGVCETERNGGIIFPSLFCGHRQQKNSTARMTRYTKTTNASLLNHNHEHNPSVHHPRKLLLQPHPFSSISSSLFISLGLSSFPVLCFRPLNFPFHLSSSSSFLPLSLSFARIPPSRRHKIWSQRPFLQLWDKDSTSM